MKIETLAEFQLKMPTGYLFSAHVQMKDRKTILFLYSSKGGVDPGEECFRPSDIGRMHLALYETDGRLLWDKELPEGVLSGIWWVPVVPFDMNGDGEDEIYLINNRLGEAFSINHRKLERWDPNTGECTASWPWPRRNFDERMSLCYRWYIVCGYAHGEPVLVTSQGTYGNMYLQGWNADHQLRWETCIKAEDPGPRASHVTPVLDVNGDGVDELLWGERVLSLDTGRELFDYAPEYNGHSDTIAPFVDYKTGQKYIYTCREGGEKKGDFRVVTFRMEGGRAWNRIPDVGHIHKGWVANVLDGYGKVCMAMSQHFNPEGAGLCEEIDGCFYYDAVTGEDADFSLPVPGYEAWPIDLDGDGYHEFIVREGERAGELLNRRGETIGRVSGAVVRMGKLLDDRDGEQIMLLKGDRVTVVGDADAKDGDIIRFRYATPYLRMMQQRLTATGYNCLACDGM